MSESSTELPSPSSGRYTSNKTRLERFEDAFKPKKIIFQVGALANLALNVLLAFTSYLRRYCRKSSTYNVTIATKKCFGQDHLTKSIHILAGFEVRLLH